MWHDGVLVILGMWLFAMAAALTVTPAQAGPECWTEVNGTIRCGVKW